ncbi:MAG: hypothetical protein Q7T03_09515 [Deltaproteobacteria bacterium]|nr:hypothetical protein [Deltaproteobacteria bacterium]
MTKHFPIFFFLFSLAACGHSSTLLQGADNTPVVDNSISSSKTDWQKLRNLAAANANTNPQTQPTLTPVNTFQAFPESDPDNLLDAFIQTFVLFAPGPGSRFGQDSMETWLLGPPYGGGFYIQSGDVVSLGNGGEIILGFPRYFPVNGSGPDFIIFENAFQPRGSTSLFAEPAIVSVSQDGINFISFPCNLNPPYDGCAGTHAVYANPDLNDLNPRDPATAGGDAFDLAEVGLRYIQFIKIKDSNLKLAGDGAVQTGQAGFDLDAIAIVHGAKP